MGFNIEEIRGSFNDNSISVYLLDEFQKAEKLGLKRIIIEKPDLMEYKDLIGQIFHYEDYHKKRNATIRSVFTFPIKPCTSDFGLPNI